VNYCYNNCQTTFLIRDYPIHQMSYMHESNNSLDSQYDAALTQVQQLNELLQKLANKDSLEDLADLTTPEDYMNLLCNSSLIQHLSSTVSTQLCFATPTSRHSPSPISLYLFFYPEKSQVVLLQNQGHPCWKNTPKIN
jgi:hypothetical protein